VLTTITDLLRIHDGAENFENVTVQRGPICRSNGSGDFDLFPVLSLCL